MKVLTGKYQVLTGEYKQAGQQNVNMSSNNGSPKKMKLEKEEEFSKIKLEKEEQSEKIKLQEEEQCEEIKLQEEEQSEEIKLQEEEQSEEIKLQEEEQFLVTLDTLVKEAAFLYELRDTKKRMLWHAAQGHLLVLYSWEEPMEVDIGLLMLPMVRLDTEDDARTSYGLKYISFFSSSFVLFLPIPLHISCCLSCSFSCLQ